MRSLFVSLCVALATACRSAPEAEDAAKKQARIDAWRVQVQPSLDACAAADPASEGLSLLIRLDLDREGRIWRVRSSRLDGGTVSTALAQCAVTAFARAPSIALAEREGEIAIPVTFHRR